MKIHIPVPCCHNCKYFQEQFKGEGITCKHPNAPEGNKNPSGYTLNCHGIGYEPTDWNGLTIEVDVSQDVIDQLNQSWNYRTIANPPKETDHEEDC